MGMFGQGGPMPLARFDDTNLSPQDKLMLLGATLRDAGSGLRGGESDALLQAQSLLAQRQMMAARQRLFGQLAGGGAQGGDAGAGGGGVDLGTLTRLAPMADMLGVPLTSTLKAAEMSKPEYVNGMRVNPYSPNAPAFVPTLDKGQAPDIDARGQVTGVRNLPGAVSAAADMAAATSNAQESAKAAYDVIPVQLPDGTTVQLPRAIAAPMLAKQAATPGGLPAVLGRSQGPAAQAADVATATAGANANVQLPQTLADAQQARDLIQVLKNNPEGEKRTGMYSILPAIPGTAGAAFDAEHNQLQGKLFMQAYNGLRGGGQITEVEGRKATEAIARLSRAQKWEDYKAALDDLDNVLASGMQRAKQQPARLQPQAAGSAPRANPLAAIPVQDRIAEARRRGLIP